MEALARLFLGQRSAVILVALILLIAGGVTATRMQEELLPNVSFNVVSIVTLDPGAAPDAVLNDVTKPIEVAVAGIPGINTLASTSAQNASIVEIQFNYGVDINQTESKVATAVAALSFPTGVVSPKVSTIDFSAFPILYVAVKNRDPRANLQETYSLVKTQVAPALSQLDGVAAADVGGGANPQVNITLHPELLARFGVSVAQITGILQANNVTIPAGNITNNGVTQPVVTNGKLTTLVQIENLPISVQMASNTTSPSRIGNPGGGTSSATGGFGAKQGGTSARFTAGQTGTAASGTGLSASSAAPRIIYLKDVATITQGEGDINTLGTTPGEITGIVRFNGQPAVSITIRKNSDANIVTVADSVAAKIKDLSKQYPQLQISTLYDSSTGIKDSVSGVIRDGALGALFAVLVIFVFLLTIRTTLVTAVSIPLSIFIAILLLGWQGFTLNVMTISGIAVAVGRVVDDSIVVLENIFRHIQSGENRRDAVIHGAAEMGRAISGSTITTVAVFLPIAFVGGIIGQFFSPFALTVVFALVASLVVALTVVPVLSSLLIFKKNTTEPERDTAIQRIYTPILRWGLAHRAITVIIALVLFLGSSSLVAALPKGFLPASDQNIVQIAVKLPAGSSLGRTTDTVARIENAVISRQPGISEWETIIGYDNGAAATTGNSSVSNAASMLAVYGTNVDMVKALDRLKADLQPYNVDGVTAKAAGVTNGPSTNNVDVQVTGSNQNDVNTATQQVLDKLRTVSGLTDLTSNSQQRQPQLNITIDAQRAFLHGLTPATAALDIRQQLTGQTATTVQLNGQSSAADVFVQVDPSASNSADRIKKLLIGSPPVAVGDIATVAPGLGPVSIARQGQQNIGDVTANISSAVKNTGAVTSNVNKAIDGLTKQWASRNVAIGQGGVGKQLTDGFVNMGIAMVVAIGLVYLIMVILFHSLLVPFVILFSLPLATIGALLGLFVTNRELDLSALIGMLMLIGIVVTNAIVLLDLVQRKVEEGDDLHTALVEGGRTRVRPILMTATATILALMPLAFSTTGGIIAASLATVVIGGLLTSTLLTLVVIPVIYSLLVGLRGWISGSRRGGLRQTSTPAGQQPTRDSLPANQVAVSQKP